MSKKLLVWDAVLAWRDHVLAKDNFRRSKSLVLSHLSRIISENLIEVDQPLSNFKKKISDIEAKINAFEQWSKFTRQSRITILRSLVKFIDENEIKKSEFVIPFKELKDVNKHFIYELITSSAVKAQAETLSAENIKTFLYELARINPRDALAVWLMIELKASLDQILSLKRDDIDLENSIFNIEGALHIAPDAGLRPDLKRCLEEHLRHCHHDLIFASANGKKLHAGQFARNSKLASQRAGLKVILTPKIIERFSKLQSQKEYSKMRKNELLALMSQYQDKIKLAHNLSIRHT